jgi:hypothetical protein
LRVALAFGFAALLAGPADAATPREKAHRRGEAAKHAQPEKLPNGPLQIIVSIGNQSVSLYANGTFVARGGVSTGMRGHPTPIGVFTVIQKDRYHRSNIYSLAPMPFMQRITWSGVALHQGVLPGYPASHGCIRLSNDFAIRLWGITKIGARVIVARHEVAPADIAHPHLFTPRPKPALQVAPNPANELELKPTMQAQPQAAIVPDLKAAERPFVNPRPTQAVRPAEMGGGGEPDAPLIKVADATPSNDAAKVAADAAMQAPEPLKPGVVSVFVSRKSGRLYVRQNYQPLFDVPVAIRDADRPLGTHVFTALELRNDGASMRWSAMTMPGDAPVRAESDSPRGKKKARHERDDRSPPAAKPAETAVQALDRIEMPKDVVERVSEMLTPGASLIISDQPISGETGRDTDFIILTH